MNFSGNTLPIDSHRDEILQHIYKYKVTCIQGETGSGKSTRVPQYILQQYEYEKQKSRGLANKYVEPRIIVTQPRRIAAKSLAKRVAEEMGVELGGKVGYKIGQEQKAGPETLMCYVTAGYLIELLVHNPESFEKYTHIILDEIHERDLDSDLLSLMMKLLMEKYTTPKLVIMSATLQVELFLKYFSEEGSVLASSASDEVNLDRLLRVGMQSPYTIENMYVEDIHRYCCEQGLDVEPEFQLLLLQTYCYFAHITDRQLLNDTEQSDTDRRMAAIAHSCGLDNFSLFRPQSSVVKTVDDYIQLALLLVRATALPSGSILIFLPGIREIELMYDILLPYEDENVQPNWSSRLKLFTLHSQIPFEDQLECFNSPADTCHVIMATNMAESSVTLPNVGVVIDFGQRRHLVYNKEKRISTLRLSWCSQASMNQRRGRTGRVCNGVCFRIMTEEHFLDQREYDPAQMTLSPLDKLLLQVKYVGDCIAPGDLPSELLAQAIEPPDTANIDTALKNLTDIGALTDLDEAKTEMTLLGSFCMDIPLDLYLCRLVFLGILFECPCDVIVMAAALQCQDPFKQPSNKVFKNQARFIESQRKSFEARKGYDDGTYSEPIMYRNMIRHWILDVVIEENERKEGGGCMLGRKQDMKTFRNKFGGDNQINAKRLELLEGVIDDVAKATLKWFDLHSTQADEIRTLMKILPRNRKYFATTTDDGNGWGNEWITMEEECGDDHQETLFRLFCDDYMLLNMVIAASFMPRFIKSKENRKDKITQDVLQKLGYNPRNSFIIPRVENAISSSEDIVTKMIRDISLQTGELGSLKEPFEYAVSGDSICVQFLTPPKQTSSKDNQVTNDVEEIVQRAFQFTENPGGKVDQKEFVYEISREDMRASNLRKNRVKLGMIQNPYRIQWTLMSSDGTPLTQAALSILGISGDPFWANYQRWRNPGGFVCDVNKREHYGVIYDVTANQRGTAGYVEGATLFPSYKQNLFALLLMIAFVPQQHGVTFIVNTDRMVITKVCIYECELPIYSDNPLTRSLLHILNRIRLETSCIFGNKDAQEKRRFPAADLRKRYDELMFSLQIGNDKLGKKKAQHSEAAGSDTDSDDCDTENLRSSESIDGFYESPAEETQSSYPYAASASSGDYYMTRNKSMYLKPFNIEVLFNKAQLVEYVRVRKPMDDPFAGLAKLMMRL